MAIKKSQLYSALWESCNALRGSMDASQYKDYVLIVLFVKYLSDKAGQPGFRLKVPEGCSFKDFVALKQDDKIGEKMNTQEMMMANLHTKMAVQIPITKNVSKNCKKERIFCIRR